jgi:hypothetical protein
MIIGDFIEPYLFYGFRTRQILYGDKDTLNEHSVIRRKQKIVVGDAGTEGVRTDADRIYLRGMRVITARDTLSSDPNDWTPMTGAR